MTAPERITDENKVEIMLALAAPFMDESVEWRVDQVVRKGKSVKLLAYLDWRAIQRRLDAVVGAWNWRTRLVPCPDNKTIAAIDILMSINGVSTWVSREAVSTDRKMHGANSGQHAVKAGATDAFKVAFVQWGGGRHLYQLGVTFADIVQQRPKGVPRCRLVKVTGKDAQGWAVAPSIRELQAELFEKLPINQLITAESYPNDRERRARRIMLAMQRGKISKGRVPLAIEAASAIVKRHKGQVYWQHMGINDLQKMNNERIKIASHTMVAWCESGRLTEMVQAYEQWKSEGATPQPKPE